QTLYRYVYGMVASQYFGKHDETIQGNWKDWGIKSDPTDAAKPVLYWTFTYSRFYQSCGQWHWAWDDWRLRVVCDAWKPGTMNLMFYVLLSFQPQIVSGKSYLVASFSALGHQIKQILVGLSGGAIHITSTQGFLEVSLTA